MSDTLAKNSRISIRNPAVSMFYCNIIAQF